MSILSTKFLSVANKLIAKFGVISQWKLVHKESVSLEDDPTAYPQFDETETVIDIAIANWKESDYDGKTIQIGDKVGYIPAKSDYPVPAIGDIVVSPSSFTTYRIVAPLTILAVNDSNVVYKVNLRG